MKFKSRFLRENINDDIDNLISMVQSKKYNKDIYTSGIEALNKKYKMNTNDDFNVLRKQLKSYSINPDKRNILSKSIIEEYEFLVN